MDAYPYQAKADSNEMAELGGKARVKNYTGLLKQYGKEKREQE